MPITPKYDMIQTSEQIELTLHMKGLKKRLLVDYIEITPIFFSFNFSPYLLQLDFSAEIDPFKINVYLKPNSCHFHFPKRIENEWDSIVHNGTKPETLKRRQQSLDELAAKREQLVKERKQTKKLRAKSARERLWEEEKIFKQAIETLEQTAQSESKAELEEWVESKTSEIRANPVNTNTVRPTNTTTPDVTLPYSSDDDLDADDDEKELPLEMDTNPNRDEQTLNDPTVTSLPPVRQSSVTKVQFSKWDYVIPARESVTELPKFARKLPLKSALESALDPIAENKVESDEDSLIPSNKLADLSPAFLLDQAASYFQHADYQSAINAYSVALRKDNTLIEAMCGRSQSYLESIQSLKKCSVGYSTAIDDCRSVLKLLDSDTNYDDYSYSDHSKFRIMALLQTCVLQFDKCSESDLSDENMTTIKRDIIKSKQLHRIREKTQQITADNWQEVAITKLLDRVESYLAIIEKKLSVPDWISEKQKGDNALKRQEFTSAIELYSNIIEKCDNNELITKCKSNQTIAYVSTAQYRQCIKLCSQLLGNDDSLSNAMRTKLYCRRGSAYLAQWKSCHDFELLQKAEQSYGKAEELDQTCARFLNQVRRLMSE